MVFIAMFRTGIDGANPMHTLHFQGTGSGVGTNVLGLLEEHYPEVYRFTTAVYPSDDDDVITSPYNRLEPSSIFQFLLLISLSKSALLFFYISVLAMHQLTEKADCVLPIENQVMSLMA